MAGWHVALHVFELILEGGRGGDHAPPRRYGGVDRPAKGAWERWETIRHRYERKLS